MKTLFVHRSVGQNMLDDSELRQRMKEIELYDLNANTQTYITPNGKSTASPVIIENGSTEPEDLSRFFHNVDNQKFLNGFDCIIFKSCYTANSLKNDARAQSQIHAYDKIISYIKAHSKQRFIFCTSPPRRPLFTDKQAAARAEEMRQWVISRAGTVKNVDVLDIFGLLSNDDGMLDKRYRRFLFFDQHPNKQGSIAISTKLQGLLDAMINS